MSHGKRKDKGVWNRGKKITRDNDMVTYKNQSTAIISPMSSNGRLTACSTMMVVTEPADGIPAAPIAIAVAVMLKTDYKQKSILKSVQTSIQFD